MTDQNRTLYALVDYTDATGTHTQGDAVQYPTDDRDANGLILRGILSPRPVRRQAGDPQQ